MSITKRIAKNFKYLFLSIWYNFYIECFKGILVGQVIRVIDNKRYQELIKIRTNLKKLKLCLNKTISSLKTKLKRSNVNYIKMYSRIKTIGSLDRKYKYAKIKYPKDYNDYILTDFLGFTIVVKNINDCYLVLEFIKSIGVFPKFNYKPNPRDYIKNRDKVKREESYLSDAIIGNILVDGCIMPIQFRIFTQQSQNKLCFTRKRYKRNIEKYILSKLNKLS